MKQEKSSQHTPGSSEHLRRFAEILVRTEGFGEIIQIFLPEILNRWAGNKRLKKRAAGFIERSIRKSFQGDVAGKEMRHQASGGA